MSKYDFTSSGVQVKGTDSYHVFKLAEVDEWVLIRYRDGTTFQAGTFVSPDEGRAFAHAMGLELNRVESPPDTDK
jgi:hypothetical protein